MNDFRFVEDSETIEDVANAKRDALKDIEDEGLSSIEENLAAAGLLKYVDALLDTSEYHWYGSFVVLNGRDHDRREHGIVVVPAESKDEALGKMYRVIAEDYPAEEGFYPPSILVFDKPVLHVPGLGSVSTNPPCPDCGDRRGQCDDVNECPNLVDETDLPQDVLDEIEQHRKGNEVEAEQGEKLLEDEIDHHRMADDGCPHPPC